jgi:hypothetical protein
VKKARLISHLSELDNIRRDEYMPQDVVDKVIELEKLLTDYLSAELKQPDRVKEHLRSDISQSGGDYQSNS